MPQLIEQWRLKSAEGIAIGFISIWFLGDLFNLVGAIWANLLPEVIFLAVWFCFADLLMIFSYVYYTHIYKKHHHHRQHSHGEHQHHHHESHYTEHIAPVDENQLGEGSPLLRRRPSTLTDIAIEPEYHSVFVKYVLPLIFVICSGILGYFLSAGSPREENPDTDIKIGPQIMGYTSAILYLGARIPQIFQNYKRKSVEGLSLLFFLFSTMGNLAYAAQILFYRTDKSYVLLNMSWLLGSLGTIFEDSFIFLQFYIYRKRSKRMA